MNHRTKPPGYYDKRDSDGLSPHDDHVQAALESARIYVTSARKDAAIQRHEWWSEFLGIEHDDPDEVLPIGDATEDDVRRGLLRLMPTLMRMDVADARMRVATEILAKLDRINDMAIDVLSREVAREILGDEGDEL